MTEKITLNGKEYIELSIYEKLKKEKVKEFDEKEFYTTDPALVMLFGKIRNLEEENEALHIVFDFERDNSDLQLMMDLKKEGVIRIMKNGEPWAVISKEYYDKAKKIISIWKGELELHVQKERDQPVLIRGEDLGFVLAPRIEGFDDD